MLRALVEGTSDAVYVKDAAGRYLLLNQAASKIVGQPVEAVIGKGDTAIFPADDAATIMTGDRRVMDSNTVQTYEEVLTDGQGETRIFLSTKGPLRNAEGAVIGIFGIARDITPLRAAEDAEHALADRLTHTMDTMLEGCQIIDRDWRYAYLNDAAERHARRSRAELLGHDFRQVWPGIESTELFRVMRNCMETRSAHRMENRFDYGEDEVGWFQLDIQPVPEGIFILSMDITERVVSRMELERYREHLEELVAARTEELEFTNTELANATQAKSQFLTSMSHELRTPLNSVIGFSDILYRGMVGDLSEEQHKQVGMIYHSGQHLLSLINEVLDLSKIEAGAVEIDIAEADLGELVREIADTLHPLAAEKDLELRVDVPERMYSAITDENKVRQILLNLGGNAIKFTDTGSIEISVRTTPTEFSVAVRDTGRGIPAQELSRIFDEFAQIDQANRLKPQGTGLGLAISRRYAELLGGRIDVTSTPGVGSTFTLVVPQF